MTQASCKTTINISTDAVWQVISEFGAAGQYLAGVITCTVEGAGVGALRTLPSASVGNAFLIPVTGFAPGLVTKLDASSRPAYDETELIREIPVIKVKTPIVGV